MASTPIPAAAIRVQPVPASSIRQRSLWQDAVDRFTRNRLAMIGAVVIGVLLFIAAFGPLLTPYDNLRQDWDAMAAPPSPAHWMGTDDLGRDLLSRILAGARTAVLVGLVTQT